jgi:selenocysteine-specific elongation factor
VARLETLAQGTPDEVLVQTLETRGPLTRKEAIGHSQLDPAEAASLVAGLIETGRVVSIGSKGPGQLLLARTMWTKLLDKATALLATYHQDNPLRPGMMREELKSRLRLSAKEFSGFMELAAQQGSLQDERVLVRLPDHEIRLTPEQQAAVDHLMHRFHSDPFGTPSYKECVRAVGADVLGVLAGRGELVQISPDVLFLAETIDQAVKAVRRYVAEHGSISVAEARDLFHSSRKYVLSLLEYLDQEGVTRREGDARVMVG